MPTPRPARLSRLWQGLLLAALVTAVVAVFTAIALTAPTC
jgi:hypothetical protein